MLFKDEVRKIGTSLKPQEILSRHPFPGPGLGIRILAKLTMKVGLIQEADKIYIDALKNGISTIKFGTFYLLQLKVLV